MIRSIGEITGTPLLATRCRTALRQSIFLRQINSVYNFHRNRRPIVSRGDSKPSPAPRAAARLRESVFTVVTWAD